MNKSSNNNSSPEQGRSLLHAQAAERDALQQLEQVSLTMKSSDSLSPDAKPVKNKRKVHKQRPHSARPARTRTNLDNLNSTKMMKNSNSAKETSPYSRPVLRPISHSTHLTIARQRKRQADAECQLFRNRIKLLQLEQQRALQQVTQTRKRVLEIVKHRKTEEDGANNPQLMIATRPSSARVVRNDTGFEQNGGEELREKITPKPPSTQSRLIASKKHKRPASAGVTQTDKVREEAVSCATRSSMAKAARKQVQDRVVEQKRKLAKEVKCERRRIREIVQMEKMKSLEKAQCTRNKVIKELRAKRRKREKFDEKRKSRFEKERIKRLEMAKQLHEESEKKAKELSQIEEEYAARLQVSQQLQQETYELFQKLLQGETTSKVAHKLQVRERKLRQLVQGQSNQKCNDIHNKSPAVLSALIRNSKTMAHFQ